MYVCSDCFSSLLPVYPFPSVTAFSSVSFSFSVLLVLLLRHDHDGTIRKRAHRFVYTYTWIYFVLEAHTSNLEYRRKKNEEGGRHTRILYLYCLSLLNISYVVFWLCYFLEKLMLKKCVYVCTLSAISLEQGLWSSTSCCVFAKRKQNFKRLERYGSTLLSLKTSKATQLNFLVQRSPRILYHSFASPQQQRVN